MTSPTHAIPVDLTLRQAGAALRSRQLSATELLEATLRRLGETDHILHAYVRVLADEARAAARRADADLAAGIDHGPLHGIPVAVKDIFDVAGVPTRCGSRLRERCAPAATDATAVALLRRGGAVIVGKTVTQEFAAGVVSAPARNPWDPDRIPGGSSGGSAAAVAAGSALAALGSDTGGSVRIPAAVTGIVGLKPTFGTVDTAGVYPLAWSLDTVGPLARTVADAATLLDLLAPGQPSARTELGQSLRGLRIGVPRPHCFERLQPGVAAAVETALGVLVGLGAELLETPWPEAAIARAVSFVINRVESAAVHREGIRRTPDRYGEELRLRLESSALLPADQYIKALQARGVVRRSAAALFAEHRLDALVTPTLPGVAAPASDPVVDYPDGSREPVGLAYTRLTMPFNATGQPALSIPCGFDAGGLPVGLQIAGRPFAEARLCRIGHAYEQAAGWHERRPPRPSASARVHRERR